MYTFSSRRFHIDTLSFIKILIATNFALQFLKVSEFVLLLGRCRSIKTSEFPSPPLVTTLLLDVHLLLVKFLNLLTSFRKIRFNLNSVRYQCKCTLNECVYFNNFLLSSTLRMEAIRSSETSVNTISTRRHIPEDGFLQINTCFIPLNVKVKLSTCVIN
jgi:hypothetical protein